MYAYNPRKKSVEQLESSLVGADRHAILSDIMAELQLQDGGSPKQHWMIVGARGMGKSHLLTLLHHKVSGDEMLSNFWLPVLFPEEIRMAGDLARFLERAINEILHDLERQGSLIVPELKEKIARIRTIRGDERADYLFSVITWIRQSTGKHILLIAENLQQLLGKRISLIEQKKLRAYLQSEDALLLIGSATTIFDALHDHSHPFYHFFHIRRLNELNYEDIRTLVINLLAGCGKEEQARIVMENEARLKVLHAFTGGNPRMAVFLSDILKTDVNEEMIDIMDRILDELTPYFEAIINDTPEYLQEIINTLAAFEPAQSPKEIAEHLEMEQATVRNYLKQAKESGYVRVAFSKGKSNFYCLNEYLYRTWFQMRDSSHREEMRWMMELMLLLYTREQLLRENSRLTENSDVAGLYQRLVKQTCDFMLANPSFCKVVEMCAQEVGLAGNGKKSRKCRKLDDAYKSEFLEKFTALDPDTLSRGEFLERSAKIFVDHFAIAGIGKLGELFSYAYNIPMYFLKTNDITTAVYEYQACLMPFRVQNRNEFERFIDDACNDVDNDFLVFLSVALESYGKAYELLLSHPADSDSKVFFDLAIALLVIQTIYHCQQDDSDAIYRSCDAFVTISRSTGRDKIRYLLLTSLLQAFRSGAVRHDSLNKLYTYAKENHPKELLFLTLWPCFESPESEVAQKLMTGPAVAKLVAKVNELIAAVPDKVRGADSPS